MSHHKGIFLTFATLATMASASDAQNVDWAAVGKTLGKEGSVQPRAVYRVGLPRSDLKVTLDGLSLKPGFALGGWVAFEPMGGQAMVMGDLVLLEQEVNPVMQKLEQSGIEITALHNHLLRSSPSTMYMHIMGHGDPMELAQKLHDALALSKTPLSSPSSANASASLDLDVSAIDEILGAKGKVNAGILQYSFPRAEEVTDQGMAVPPAMGSAIAINFQPTEGGNAAITGDFVLTGTEVTQVLKALRNGGIEVTALHSHMLDEQPRLYFMHFWANDNAQKLAHGLRGGLDKVNLKKGS